MRQTRLVVWIGLVLALAACGQIRPPSSAGETPVSTPSAESAPLTMSGALHAGEVGLLYAPVAYQATGGSPPYLWTVSDGVLPSGLLVSTDGVISGTPTGVGTFNFTMKVTDTEAATASDLESINVVPQLKATLTRSGHVTAKQGSSAAVSAFAAQTGGAEPYSYSVTSGSLPAGTNLSALSLTGAFTKAGSYTFTVTVTDALGATTAVSPSYYIWGPIAFSPMWYTPTGTADHRFAYADVECRGTNATGCNAQFAYSGGSPGVSPRVSQAYAQAAWQGLPGWAPGQDSALHGLSVTVSGGAVHVTVAPNANPLGWTGGKVFTVLIDPQTGDTTRAAEFRIYIFA